MAMCVCLVQPKLIMYGSCVVICRMLYKGLQTPNGRRPVLSSDHLVIYVIMRLHSLLPEMERGHEGVVAFNRRFCCCREVFLSEAVCHVHTVDVIKFELLLGEVCLKVIHDAGSKSSWKVLHEHSFLCLL